MATIESAINQARVFLQDSRVPYRYTTEELFAIFNEAMTELRRARPDVFFDDIAYNTEMFTDLAADLPVDAIFFTPIVNFIVGRAELRDDEFTNDGRALTLYQAFFNAVRGAR